MLVKMLYRDEGEGMEGEVCGRGHLPEEYVSRSKMNI